MILTRDLSLLMCSARPRSVCGSPSPSRCMQLVCHLPMVEPRPIRRFVRWCEAPRPLTHLLRASSHHWTWPTERQASGAVTSTIPSMTSRIRSLASVPTLMRLRRCATPCLKELCRAPRPTRPTTPMITSRHCLAVHEWVIMLALGNSPSTQLLLRASRLRLARKVGCAPVLLVSHVCPSLTCLRMRMALRSSHRHRKLRLDPVGDSSGNFASRPVPMLAMLAGVPCSTSLTESGRGRPTHCHRGRFVTWSCTA
mmetsp:Transcript_16051/g.34843  ORF Transcript_16051/g.34843 Transcript_16051/m.34843 type:complete len:254 (+) Transcript_16051:394-1155(+)